MSKLRNDIKALSLNKRRIRDYDPEDIAQEDRDNETDTDSEHDEPSAGREHYETVGKSRLRRPDAPVLDRKYGGVVISRDALADENSDPLAMQSSDEGENVFGRSAAAEDESSHDESSPQDDQSDVATDEDSESGLDKSDSDIQDFREDGDSEEADPQTSESDEEGGGDDRPQSTLRQQAAAFAAASSQSIAASLSQAASQEVEKGEAIRKQHQTLDRILDARMKLQKGVIAADELGGSTSPTGEDAEAALSNAKQAAMQLFNTMTLFRETLNKSSTENTKKRKRDLDATSSLPEQWDVLTDLENDVKPVRVQTINKWSNRTKQGEIAAKSMSSRSKLLDSDAQNRQITAVLDVFVINEQEKQFASWDNAQLPVYDDNTFYQSLLRDLIARRSATSGTSNSITASVLPPKLHPSGNRQNKKNIDTKASKGRKIRYTIHEKLQNFMASEGDTGRNTAMWTDRGKREFFGSLFGQDRALNEDSDAEMENDQVDGEQAALRLFNT